ncbi:MAG: hypothetical protein ACLQAH_03885 [Limisphaerales bacterium]
MDRLELLLTLGINTMFLPELLPHDYAMVYMRQGGDDGRSQMMSFRRVIPWCVAARPRAPGQFASQPGGTWGNVPAGANDAGLRQRQLPCPDAPATTATQRFCRLALLP